jgi:ribosome maturation factor RimP
MTYRKEGSRKVLRILADKGGSITLEECARMNEIIGGALDSADFMEDNYILEVSSPGLDRPLKTRADFERIKGKRIRAHTYEPVDGKRELAGVLQAVEDDSIIVSDEGGKQIKIQLDKISKATFDYKSLI